VHARCAGDQAQEKLNVEKLNALRTQLEAMRPVKTALTYAALQTPRMPAV
jgi:hypothetical protein